MTCVCALSSVLALALAIASAAPPTDDPNRPDLQAIAAQPRSELIAVIDRYNADLGAIERTYSVGVSARRQERLKSFREGWLASLDAMDVAALSLDGRVDWLLLRTLIRREARRAELDRVAFAAVAQWLPDPQAFVELIESRETLPALPGSEVAERLTSLAATTRASESALRTALAARRSPPEGTTPAAPSASECRRALLAFGGVRRELESWYRFRNGYDPEFTWWTEAPWKDLVAALDAFERLLREEGVGQTPTTPDVIVGTPIGREALLNDLRSEWIAYSPEELIAIAEREFAWCEGELHKAAEELACDDDWKKALEIVKSRHVEPGKQPEIIRQFADEAVAFLRERDLVTVPALADETWRMEMMSPARQLMTPFFTGGEVISIAFPTEGMTHEQKRMALRGNNVHFSHATVFHELIPGHRLQQYAQERHKSYRAPFATPFWTEGWALHWEMFLWDLGFHPTPEDRIGALFWRAHRAARIIFSLRFHLGEMSAQECVDFLVERVGHERANAEGEVRRAVSGDYSPLYQVAYMIGGLQFRALYRELVGGGKLSPRAFHDAILAENNLPVECLRILLTGEEVGRDREVSWRFDGGQPAGARPLTIGDR